MDSGNEKVQNQGDEENPEKELKKFSEEFQNPPNDSREPIGFLFAHNKPS